MFPLPHVVSDATVPSCPSLLLPQQYAVPSPLRAHVWLPPALTEAQSPCPSSVSTGNRPAGAVASVHAANAATAAASHTRDRDGRDMDLKKPGLRAAVTFGVIAATLEMGVLLWMMRC